MYIVRTGLNVQLKKLSSSHLSRNLSSNRSTTPVHLSDSEFQSAIDYCSSLLLKYDSPSYTLQTFIPSPTRTAYLAIRALNVELARIPDTTSSPAIGNMRLQFWRDNINSTFAGQPPKHPVSILLSHALSSLSARNTGSGQLSKPWFLRLVSAREQYLSNPPYPSLDALEQYAENTYSTLLYLTLGAIPLSSLAADHLASHIGKATGIAAVLRGIPLLAFPHPPNHHSNSPGQGGLPGPPRTRQGVVTLPLDIMASTGVREEDVLRMGADAPGLRDAVFEVATRASDHLITARQMLKELQAGREAGHAYEHAGEEGHEYHSPHARTEGVQGFAKQNVPHELEQAFGVLMPAVATGLWLSRLEKLDFDIFAPDLRRREWRLPWRAYWAWRRRMF
ncbi:hypothetical protein MMC22_007250 [Lobaria immixta]|nr:hypothetical protein [Lobaria immixta]